MVPNSSSASSWELFTGANGLEFCEKGIACGRFTLEAGGNIGIGTCNPAYHLQVNGSVVKPGGGSWTAASDQRLKDNIVPFEDGLTKVMTIKPVKFHYNKRSGFDTKKEHIGVIAQELKKISPYMVGTFEQDGKDYFDVDNSAMTYLLINAVQEQQKELEASRQQKEALETKLITLEKRLAALEQQ